MKRRAFIAGLGSGTAWPLMVRGQQPTMPVIGVLGIGTPELAGIQSARGLHISIDIFTREL